MGSSRPVRRAPGRRSAKDLWQVPLLIGSLGLFGYAAYLFIDPKAGPSIDEKINVARTYLGQERPDAALEYLNRLLSSEKLDKLHEGQVHLMLAEGLAAVEGQKDAKYKVPRRHEQIIEQTRLALASNITTTYEIERRVAESYEALHKSTEALKHYRTAMAMDPEHSIRMHRKIVDLQLNEDDPDAAAASLEEYLGRHDLTDSERAWALGEQAHLKIDHGNFAEARALLAQAAKLSSDPVDLGQNNFWLGYCAWKLDDTEEAERFLRLSRDQMRSRHPLDGDAAFILGRLSQDRHEWKMANSFYEVVIVNHPDSRLSPLAKLGRGVCRVMLGEDEAGLTDLHDVATRLNERGEGKTPKFKDEALAGLRQAGDTLTARGNYQGSLELLAYEQDLEPKLPATFFARLANVYEKRAGQVDRIAATAKPAEQLKMQQQVRDLRIKAGDAYVAYSRQLTLTDDKGYGDALWKGIDLYDQAGDLPRVTSALKVFINERPTDLLAADALLRLGRSYQALGQFDDAIAAFQQNMFRHPSSLAANRSAIPLAQAYIAKGPEFYAKAEKTLQDLLDNPLVTPEALEFRQSLFELAQLYYRTNRFEPALAKLDELTKRYPKDEQTAQLQFLTADSYRKSALLLGVAATGGGTSGATTQPAATSQPAIDPQEAIAAKKLRLVKAREMYEQVVETYRVSPPKGELDKLYLKLSHFYRADCAYDLGLYQDAIRLYDGAAFRYQDDSSSLSAYVQIVNSYCALGKFEEARTANERAKVLLKRMPAEAFSDGSFAMPKEYWQEWLKWTGDSGIWNTGTEPSAATQPQATASKP